ncbi:MAG: hypothetical protein E6H60_09725 [Betaproteobacteria bacterium]|nr:MAG: hypothetical protein E6H60_09725 [Betaproteobacteria bacterium]
MLFRYHEISTLPPLAWGARVDRGGDAALVFHGMFVETHSRGFIEGAWNDSFASLNFTAATIVAGTGGILEHDRVRFSTSTDRLGPLFSIVKDGSVYVSNSPAFVMTMSGEEPDDIYPFYDYDLLHIYRQGLYCPNGHLRLRSATRLGVHFSTIITVDERAAVRFDSHRLCELPRDYQTYKELLLEGTRKVLDNGADPARKRSYGPLASLSRGYDSTAATVLAKAAGCADAFTYIDDRCRDPKCDSGASNARFFLGMRCKVYSRWQYLALGSCPEAEFGYAAANSMVPLAAVEDQLPGRILILGDYGDTIWDPKAAKVSNQLSRPWVRHTHGLSPVEFRLRVAYLAFAPASIAARHNRIIHDIATSEAMRPWSVGGGYDRPIPRRIAEEAGLPRDRFGIDKVASSHSHLRDPSRFSEKGLNHYRRFVSQRHAEVPRPIYNYWRARARWRHYLWTNTNGHEDLRYVHSTPLQRHFPFILNAKPIPIPWDYMFTFQWTVASMRSRYALPQVSVHA